MHYVTTVYNIVYFRKLTIFIFIIYGFFVCAVLYAFWQVNEMLFFFAI